MTYSWTFKNLNAVAHQGDLSDVVVSVDYRVGYTVDRSKWSYKYGTVSFSPADESVFTPFADITEDDMISFVQQTLGDEWAAIQAQLQADYANPVSTRTLPWIPEVVDAYAEGQAGD